MILGEMVSVPYEITLLSNELMANVDNVAVSVPYEITLLSNPRLWKYFDSYSFSTL